MCCVKWVQKKIRGIHNDFYPQLSPVCCDFSKQAMRMLCKERTEIVCSFQLINLVWTPVFCAHGFGCWISQHILANKNLRRTVIQRKGVLNFEIIFSFIINPSIFHVCHPPSKCSIQGPHSYGHQEEMWPTVHRPCWSSDHSSYYAHALFRNWSSSYVCTATSQIKHTSLHSHPPEFIVMPCLGQIEVPESHTVSMKDLRGV